MVRNVYKGRMTFVWGEVSAPGGAGKGTVSPSLQWLALSCTRKLSAIFQENSLSQSPFISLPICQLPTPFTLFLMSPNSLIPPPLVSLCQPPLNQIDCRCVSTVREDSLPLYACNLSAWHSTSPNLPCHNLSADPKHTKTAFMHAGRMVILFIIYSYLCIHSEV